MSGTKLQPLQDLNVLHRSVNRIFSLATLGFKATVGKDPTLNWIFTQILLETNKLRNALRSTTSLQGERLENVTPKG